jgi:hypothetical protein
VTKSDFAFPLSRVAFCAALVAVIAIHIGLIAYFDYPLISLNPEPISGGDFDIHIGQSWHIIEAIEGWHKTWLYDPHLVAGYPVGTVSEANNNAWTLLTWCLWKLGLPKGTAHNSFLLLAHVLLLPVMYFSARLFGLRRWASVVAMAMGSALWFFDSFCHWMWWIGTVAYAMVSFLTLLSLALFYRFIQDRRFWLALLTAISVGIGVLVHAFSFLILVWPMAALYIRAFRTLSIKEHAYVAIIPVITFAINFFWIIDSLGFIKYILNSGYYLKASIAFFFADFFGLLLNTSTSGVIANRTAFRFLFLGASIVMLVIWKRSQDKRFLPFAIGIGVLFGVAYLGAYLKPLTQVQPYRYILPGTFLLPVPAAALIERVWGNRMRFRPPGVFYAAVAILCIPGFQHLSSDILYYFSDQMPRVPPTEEGVPIYYSSSGYLPHQVFRHSYKDVMDMGLSDWINHENDGIGRFLVQFGLLGERLIWKTDAEIIGGFPYRNLAYTYSNFFRPREDLDYKNPEVIREYFETFAIKWVITDYPDRRLLYAFGLLDLYQSVGGHQIYRTNVKIDLFASGSGRIRSKTNVIEVEGTKPQQDIVLRYNWMHTLVCEPHCVIERAPNKFSPIGFIRVPAPHPTNFVIRNGY